jgi:hypothetical protein
VRDLEDALRKDVRADGIRAELERRIAAPLLRVLRQADEESRRAAQNLTLRELAELSGGSVADAPPETPRPSALGDGERPVSDAK